MTTSANVIESSEHSIDRYLRSSRPVIRIGGGYDGDTFEFETIGYWNCDVPSWGCPAWEERGFPDLCGPFATYDDAKVVMRREREYLESCGYRVVD